ncbi:hypothetical protein D3C76_1168340 [compost metagenome]
MKTRVASSPCLVLYSARIGTKAWENAPSAKIRRSRLGSLKATKKASVAMPAPNMRATMVSRTKPSTRDTMVMELTAASDLSRFMKSANPGSSVAPLVGATAPTSVPAGNRKPWSLGLRSE